MQKIQLQKKKKMIDWMERGKNFSRRKRRKKGSQHQQNCKCGKGRQGSDPEMSKHDWSVFKRGGSKKHQMMGINKHLQFLTVNLYNIPILLQKLKVH